MGRPTQILTEKPIRRGFVVAQLEEAIVGFLLREGENALPDYLLDFLIPWIREHRTERCRTCRRSYMIHALAVFDGNLTHTCQPYREFEKYHIM
jgi:hypothetical protein